MPREFRAAALASTLALTVLVAGCGDGGKTTGIEDRSRVSAARTRPTGNVTKASRQLASLSAQAADNLETVDLSDHTATELVQTIVGEGVTVSNVHYDGADVAAGTFTGPDEIVGFGSGIVLSTGNISDVVGPNEEDGITTVNSEPGDDDLSELAGFDTFDAAVLTFDFVAAGETVTFKYVFASDEYNEFVNTQFNDVFAFFINGENCAVVGDPEKPVSINTINNGNPDLPDLPGVPNPVSNPDLYRNNDLDDDGGDINTEMDGLTEVLTCEAAVTPGEKNTMKIAIADASDDVLDAVVFIEAGSFAAPNQPPTADITAPDNNSTFAQGTNINFTGTGSDPEDGNLTGSSLAWSSSRDGDLGTGTSISVDDLSVGTHTITLTATDSQGEKGTATIEITITGTAENQPPVPEIDGPTTGEPGDELSFTTGATDPDGDSPLTCEISFGGAFTALSSCDAGATHTFDEEGTFTVTLRATDPDGAVGTVTHTVTITQEPPPACSEGTGARPTLNLVGVFSRIAVRAFAEGIPEGEMLRFSFGDPDCGPWTAHIEWGDGETSEFPITEELGPGLYNTWHIYAEPGTYTVRMTITDDAGLASTEQSIEALVIDESGTP